MPMNEILSDLPDFLQEDDFAVEATLFPGEAGERTIYGLFDNDHFEVETGATIGISSTRPSLLAQMADIADVVQGSAVRVESVDYKVIDISPDGTGLVDLVLIEKD